MLSEPDIKMLEKQQSNKRNQEKQRDVYLREMKSFWPKQLEEIDHYDFKKRKPALPLARIKKIMKSDEDVRMISAEAPILFSKACEIFILDLTMRAWSHTDENKRRTLQRSDVAEAIVNYEMFDFLIDIVPRDEDTKSGNTTESMLNRFFDPRLPGGNTYRRVEHPLYHPQTRPQMFLPLVSFTSLVILLV
jgi:histone H3/H4